METLEGAAFDKIGGSAKGHTGFYIGDAAGSTENDEVRIPGVLVLLQNSQALKAIHFWHVKVEENKIKRWGLVNQVDGLEGVAGYFTKVTGVFSPDGFTKQLLVIYIVVND